MGVWGIDMGKLSANENNEVTDEIGVNTGENNGDKMTKNNEEIINEVSDSYKNELTSSSGKIVENRVFEGDIVKINSDDELEKEWKESLQVEGLERGNFSRGVVGGEEKSSRVYLAVSYTHLDVYKRQAQYGTIWIIGGI